MTTIYENQSIAFKDISFNTTITPSSVDFSNTTNSATATYNLNQAVITDSLGQYVVLGSNVVNMYNANNLSSLEANNLSIYDNVGTNKIEIVNNQSIGEPYINIVGSGADKSLYEPTQIGFYQGSDQLSSLNATTLNFTDSLTFSASNISSSDGNLLCEGGHTAILKGYNDAILWSSDGSVEIRPNDIIGDLILTGTHYCWRKQRTAFKD